MRYRLAYLAVLCPWFHGPLVQAQTLPPQNPAQDTTSQGWQAIRARASCQLQTWARTGDASILVNFYWSPFNPAGPSTEGLTLMIGSPTGFLDDAAFVEIASPDVELPLEATGQSRGPKMVGPPGSQVLRKSLEAGRSVSITVHRVDGMRIEFRVPTMDFGIAAAMFDGCVNAMSSNNAMQRSALVVTPLAGAASGYQRIQSASGAPTARRR